MHPILTEFTIANMHVVVYSYPTMLLIAALACSTVFAALALRSGIELRDVTLFIAVTGLAALVGAQLGHALDVIGSPAYRVASPGDLISGHSLAGALLLASGVGWVSARRLGLSPWKLADFSAPALGLGIALAKTGCLLQGCCFGKPYSGWGALMFPPGSPAWSWQVDTGVIGPLSLPVSVWPVQIIEGGAALLLGAVALYLLFAPWAPQGTAFLFFTSCYAIVRCTDTLIRAQSAGPIGYLVLASGAALCAYFVAMRFSEARGARPSATAS